MTAEQLRALRRAMRTLYQQDRQGYVNLARIHRDSCPHRAGVFLPWHRSYIWQLELRLRRIDPSVSLPYWDWSSPHFQGQGIPAAFTAGGDNPLLRGPLDERLWTSRQPGHPRSSLIMNSSQFAANAMRESSYERFWRTLEQAHDNVHVWVAGSMGDIRLAAHDPLFWAHHANVDRLWALWQRNNTGGPAPSVSLRGLPGWEVRHTLSTQSLGYQYDDFLVRHAPPPPHAFDEPVFRSEPMPSTPRMVVEIDDVDAGRGSFVIHVFARPRGAGAESEILAGSIGVFGTVMQPGMHAHAAHARDTRQIDVTDVVQRLGLRREELELRVEIEDPTAPHMPLANMPLANMPLANMPRTHMPTAPRIGRVRLVEE